MRLLVKGFGVDPLDIEVANEEEAVNKFFDISGEYLDGRSSNEIYQVIVNDDGSMINISHNGNLTPMEEYCKKWISRDCEFAQEIIKLGYTGPFRGDGLTENRKNLKEGKYGKTIQTIEDVKIDKDEKNKFFVYAPNIKTETFDDYDSAFTYAVSLCESNTKKPSNGLKEGEVIVVNRNGMMQRARQNGCGFVANTPSELKQGLTLMKRQLQDMEAHRRQYELALQSGIVVAGFGGNLDGIEVPETLMTGQVPPGMTPSQAFDEVVDYMRKTIEALSTKLGDSSVKNVSLPRRTARYLESKKSNKKNTLKESEDVRAKILKKAIQLTKDRITGKLSIGDELQATISELKNDAATPEEQDTCETLCLSVEPSGVETLAKSVDPKGFQVLVKKAKDFKECANLKKSNKKKIQERWRGADITYEWELRDTFKDLINHAYNQSKGKLGQSEIEQAFKDAMDDILEADPSAFHDYDDEDPAGWYFIFGVGDYSVYARDDNEYKVEWSDGIHSIEPIMCSSEDEARQIIKEFQDAEK